MNVEQLKMLLNENKANFDLVYHETPIYTVQDGIKYFDISCISPVFILKTENGFFAFISSTIRERIDFKKIKEVLNCKKVKLAGREEVKEVIGYEAGNVPIIGHNLPCIFDSMLLEKPFIYGGSGDENHTLKINPKDAMKVNNVVGMVD